MAAVFAQVNRNPVGAGLLCAQCRFDRIGTFGAAGLAHRGDMIHVDT
jgi:hypothetical protein